MRSGLAVGVALTALSSPSRAWATGTIDLTLEAGDAIAGRSLAVTVGGLVPGESTVLLWSAGGVGTGGPCHGRAALCSQLAPTVVAVAVGPAGADGRAHLVVQVPFAVPLGSTGALEAWALRGASSSKSPPLLVTVVAPDDDRDGFRSDVDCDDADDRVFPGQRRYATTPRVSGGFDFNCDGVETKAWTIPGYCSAYYSGTTWGGPQWTCYEERGFLNDPACGQSGTMLDTCWGTVTQPSSAGCSSQTHTELQPCL